MKDELVVARNRFLAESMLNGGQSQLKKSPLPKTTAAQLGSPIGPKKYSVPTCHTTLKQMEQAKLAREFEQQRKTLHMGMPDSFLAQTPDQTTINNNNNTEYETGKHLGNPDFVLKNSESGFFLNQKQSDQT